MNREHEQSGNANSWRDRVITMALAVILGGGGGLLMSAADGARVDQRATELERRVSAIEEAQGQLSAVRQDLAALSARVDAWRTSDVAARASRDQSIDQRLERIEDALYGRR